MNNDRRGRNQEMGYEVLCNRAVKEKIMNNLVYIGSLCPGEEFFYRGKHYRVYGHMIRNGIECVACYIPQNSSRTLSFFDLWMQGVRFNKSHGSH